MVTTKNPKEMMQDFPQKFFVIIGPFDNHNDKQVLRMSLKKAVNEYNESQRKGKLHLHERC